MDIEPNISEITCPKIDESSILGNETTVLWMFGIIDRVNKNARVWCGMNDRLKEKILIYVKNNIFTPEIENNREFVTRIYSDGFSSDRKEDFTEVRYICTGLTIWFGLPKVNFIQIQ